MENDMNNLQVSMNHKRIAIDNNIAIDFMEKFPNKLDEFFTLSGNSYVFDREITYLSEKANIIIVISYKIDIYIIFKDYVYLDNTILNSNIVRRFIKKYPILSSSYELINQ